MKEIKLLLRYIRSILLIHLLLISTTISGQITNPRPWAEWEETEGVIIHQPNYYVEENPTALKIQIAEEWDRLYLDLINGLFDEGVNIYYILDTNDRPEYHSSILDTMHLKYGVDINHPSFHVVYGSREDYNRLSKWTRDHGPMNIYKEDVDSLYFYLFSDDNRGSGAIISNYLNIPDTVFYSPGSGNSASDGGNYMTDGNEMAIINCGSDVVLPELKSYFGLNTVHCMPDYLYHIDYYLKIINEETLIMATHSPDDYTSGSEPYSYEEDSLMLSQRLTFVQENIISQYGRPMKVVQLPSPPSMISDSLGLWYHTQYASYVNSLIVNKSVFVPQFDVPYYDSLALKRYEDAMPGYRIVPVYSRRGLSEGGAVHCLTNSVASPEPVLIRHAWYTDTVDKNEYYPIEAYINSRSGISDAQVYFSDSPNGPYQEISMNSSDDTYYSCNIPHIQGVDKLYYYISARSNSGKNTTKPFVAPDHAYEINIGEDNQGVVARVSTKYGRLKVFPNPASSYTNIAFSPASFGNEFHNLTFIIYDIYGKTCIKKHLTTDENQFNLDISSLASGTYFIILHDEWGRFMSEKLVVM